MSLISASQRGLVNIIRSFTEQKRGDASRHHPFLLLARATSFSGACSCGFPGSALARSAPAYPAPALRRCAGPYWLDLRELQFPGRGPRLCHRGGRYSGSFFLLLRTLFGGPFCLTHKSCDPPGAALGPCWVTWDKGQTERPYLY